MKHLKLICIIALLILGCREEEAQIQMGCLTAIRAGGTEREFIRCCTYDQFMAGTNADLGGTPILIYYGSEEWEPVSDCGQCQ